MTDLALIPLSKFKEQQELSNKELGLMFGGFTSDGIRKMISDKKRKIAVYGNDLVEIVNLDVLETVIDPADINWPHEHKVMILKKINKS